MPNVIKNAFKVGGSGNVLNRIDNILSGISSFIKFRDQDVGLINDNQGIEQVRLLSDREFHFISHKHIFTTTSVLLILLKKSCSHL